MSKKYFSSARKHSVIPAQMRNKNHAPVNFHIMKENSAQLVHLTSYGFADTSSPIILEKKKKKTVEPEIMSLL